MNVQNWRLSMKDCTARGLPFEDSKIRSAHHLGNISTDAIDSLTWNKIANLQDSQLENTVIAKLLSGSNWTFDYAVESAKNDITRDTQLKADTQKVYENLHRSLEADKTRAAEAQTELTRKAEQIQQETDAQLDRIKHLGDKPATFTPQVTERTFCGFCSEFHATKILMPCGEIREYPLSTWHVRDSMKADSEGWETEQPNNMDRCMCALTTDKGLSKQDAENKCQTLLSDPVFLHDFINFPVKTSVTKPSKEDLFIGKAVAANIHPELAKRMFDKEQAETLNYIQKLADSGELEQIYRQRRSH